MCIRIEDRMIPLCMSWLGKKEKSNNSWIENARGERNNGTMSELRKMGREGERGAKSELIQGQINKEERVVPLLL